MRKHHRSCTTPIWTPLLGRRALTVLVVAAIVVLALTGSAVALTFTDVPDNNPYRVAITDLASRQIISGFADGSFRPDASVTRQQFAKMIVKTLGITVTGTEVCPFTDVDTTPNPLDPNYPAKYVAVCAAHGITTGIDATHFGPGLNIKRQQMITMVARAANLPAPPGDYTPAFTPAQFSSDEHYQNARKTAYAGLLDGIVGVGPAYNFLADATRGECAQLLHNLLLREMLPAGGDLLHFWWQSGRSLGSWQVENVSTLLGGYQVAGDMDSYGPVSGSPYDHVFAADTQGDLLMFMVTPGGHDWQVTDLSALTGVKIAPSGVWSFVTGSESQPTLHLMTIGPDRDLLHFWRPPDGSWHSEDVTQEVANPPREPAKVTGAPSISWDGSVPANEGNMVAAPGLADELLLFHFHADTAGWSVEDVSAGLAVTFAGEAEADDVPGLELSFTDVLGRFQFLERTSSSSPWSVHDVSSIVGYQFAHGPNDIIIPGSVTTDGSQDDQVHYLAAGDQAALIHLWRVPGGTWQVDNVSAKTGQPVAHLMHAFVDWVKAVGGPKLYHFYVGVAPNHDLVVSAGDIAEGAQADWQVFDVTGQTGFKVNMGEAFWWDESLPVWQGNLMVTHYQQGQG